VSARHVSFLETGRAQPSHEMLLKLAAVLRVPLRDRNVMLHAAGFAEAFAEPALGTQLMAAVEQALERMLSQHEPYPMAIVDRHYNMLRANQGAMRVLTGFLAEPSVLPQPLNVFQLLFDPRLGRPFVVDWERTARGFLSRLHIEALEHPTDTGMSELIAMLLAYPGVPKAWRHPDFGEPVEPASVLRLRRDDVEIGFITTLTVFSAPGTVTLDELRIESYFPIDDATCKHCQAVANAGR
jgi:transcriptional regulator with XRE-family HTH domain